MSEIWNPYAEGMYEISNIGNVRRAFDGRPVKTSRSTNGYLVFVHHFRPHRKTILVHRAVAETFLGPIPAGMEVNHKDGNKLNPCVDNLEYLTKSDNCKHAYRLGLAMPPTTRASGDNHWTRKHPDLVKRGKENGAAKHPECILRGNECPASKLTEQIVMQIRDQHATGTPKTALAERFGVTRRNISMIVNRQSWRHIA